MGCRLPDERARQQLIESYRTAWLGGDRDDRYAVLDFVRGEKLLDGLDLIVGGVRGHDEGLATHAAAIAWFLISKGVAFDQTLKNALEGFGRRFPKGRVLSDSALRRLARQSNE